MTHNYYPLQVHPAKLTHALMSAAQAAAGSKVLLATVTGVTTDSSGKVTAVTVQRQQAAAEEELAADAVVLAMGPWTDAARAWLPAAPATTGALVCGQRMRLVTCNTAATTTWKVNWHCMNLLRCDAHVLLLRAQLHLAAWPALRCLRLSSSTAAWRCCFCLGIGPTVSNSHRAYQHACMPSPVTACLSS
jgi:hypothetical protein